MRLIDADDINFESNEFDTYNDYLTAFDAVDKAETIDSWHYPAKGELPDKYDNYLVVLELSDEEKARKDPAYDRHVTDLVFRLKLGRRVKE